jgi:hypothetical protein
VKKNDGITVYIPKETILKLMAARIEYVKPAFLFFHLVQELSDTPGTCCLHSMLLTLTLQMEAAHMSSNMMQILQVYYRYNKCLLL